MPLIFTAFLALAVARVAAQCPDSLINRTRCNPVESVVGPDAETCNLDPDFAVQNALEWAFKCQLPVEIRIGVTMSLTGNYSNPSMNAMMLEVFRNWSSEISTKSVAMSREGITLGQIQMCSRFCVMDDESSETKMVELYRAFADGDGNSTHSPPILLGPSTERFRNQAAQVANDYQKPMILWSIPKELRSFPLAPQKNWLVSEVIEQIELPSNQVIRDEIAAAGDVGEGLYGSWYDTPTYSCEDFPVPTGYYLRSGAELLSCGGPCDPVAHLDLCCRPNRGLSASGTWSPNHALVSGAWQDGCLRGQSLANETTNMSLVLNFETSPAHVAISMNWNNTASSAPQPFLVVAEQVFVVGTVGVLDELHDNAALYFSYLGDAEVTWEICLRESCNALECSNSIKQSAAFCQGPKCSELDRSRCCSADPEDLNGILWKNGFTSVFDLVSPVSTWAMDAIQQAPSGRMLCVADGSGHFFANLCHYYAKFVGDNMADVTLAYGALEAVTAVARVRPAPSFVLVCGDLNFYTGFLHASQMVAPEHGTVGSCVPFGSLLDSVRGFQLNFRSLEPQPWPSYAALSGFKITKPVADLASLRLTFSEAYTLSSQKFNGSFPTELLFLYSAWQVIDHLAMRVAESVLEYSFLRQRGRRDCMEVLVQWTFSTYLGAVSLKEQGFRSVSRIDVATRQFVPLNVAEASTRGITANVSWTLKMVRFLRSDVRVANLLDPIIPVTNQVDSNAWYPCPEGCFVWHTSCHPCPPGTYRSLSMRQCRPCLSGTYQNSYAASRCFPCPSGGTCNVTGAPLAQPGYFALPSQEFMLYALWNGPDACSIGTGGGLAKLHPNDVERWSASKKDPQWEVLQCKPKFACLGENQCSASQTGPACIDCQKGYTRVLGHREICVACLEFSPLLQRSLIFASVQVLAVLLLVWATHTDADELGVLWCPILKSLLTAIQSFWMLLEIMGRATTDTEASYYDGLRHLLDPFMVPFLLPLFDCTESLRSVENQTWSVLASAVSIYVVILVLRLLLYLWSCILRRRKYVFVTSCLVATTQVVLPCLVYWTIQMALLCTNPEAACDERPGLQEPHVVALTLVCLLVFLEAYAVWIFRHDFFQVQHREAFGLLSSGLYRDYFWWPTWEFIYLLALTAVLSLCDALDVPVVVTFWFSVILQGISYAMMVSFTPYKSIKVPAFKKTISWVMILQSVLYSVIPVLQEGVPFIHQIDQILAYLLLLFVLLQASWLLFINRILIPLAVKEHTFYPFRFPSCVHSLSKISGLHRIQVTKRGKFITFYSHPWSKSQRADTSWSIGHIIGGQMRKSRILNMNQVDALLESAIRALLRAHKSACLRHVLLGGQPRAQQIAWRQGTDIPGSILRHAGFIIAHELSVAIHDANMDSTVDEFKRRKRDAANEEDEQDSETEELREIEAGLPEELIKKWEKKPERIPKVRVEPQYMPRRPSLRVTSAAQALAVARSMGSMPWDEEDEDSLENVEKRLWQARKRWKMLESKLPSMLRSMAGAKEAVTGIKSVPNTLSQEVKEVLTILNEIQMYLDSIGADKIFEGKLTAWIGHVQHVTQGKAPELAIPKVPASPLASELVEFLCEEGNQVDLETGATHQPVSRSNSEDSLELQLRRNVVPSSGGNTAAFSAASMAIMKSKPRRVGRKTARLH